MAPDILVKEIRVRVYFIRKITEGTKTSSFERVVKAHADSISKAWKIVWEKVAIIEEEENANYKSHRIQLNSRDSFRRH
jgi:hypothetical protein